MKILNNLKKKYALLSISTACSLLVTSMPVRLMTTDSVEAKGYEIVEDNIIDNNITLITTINTTSVNSTSTLISSQTITTLTPTTSTISNTEVTGVNTIQNFESPLVNNSIDIMEEVIELTAITITPTTSITTTTTTTSPTITTIATTTAVTTTTEPVETSVDSTTSTTTTTATTNNKEDIYVVYKPSTHYIHTNKCRWYDNTCKKIENTEGLEVRKCSECNPDMKIVKEYKPPVNTKTTASSYGLSDYDIMLLRKIVSSEYGADWVPVAEKAKIVASVMAMVRNPRFPNTISGVLAVACEPWGFNRYRNYYMSDSIIAAVDYYLANQNTIFAGWCYTSWWGDGRYNHFYC